MVSAFDRQRKAQKTVKAFDTDIAFINERAKDSGCSAAEIIHVLCDDLRKEVYLQELGESFDLLRGNSKQFAKFQAEQEAWDCTLSDGLDDAS